MFLGAVDVGKKSFVMVPGPLSLLTTVNIVAIVLRDVPELG